MHLYGGAAAMLDDVMQVQWEVEVYRARVTCGLCRRPLPFPEPFPEPLTDPFSEPCSEPFSEPFSVNFPLPLLLPGMWSGGRSGSLPLPLLL